MRFRRRRPETHLGLRVFIDVEHDVPVLYLEEGASASDRGTARAWLALLKGPLAVERDDLQARLLAAQAEASDYRPLVRLIADHGQLTTADRQLRVADIQHAREALERHMPGSPPQARERFYVLGQTTAGQLVRHGPFQSVERAEEERRLILDMEPSGEFHVYRVPAGGTLPPEYQRVDRL